MALVRSPPLPLFSLLLLLPLILLCQMVADDAARCRAEHRVVPREVARHRAHGGTLDATLGLGAVGGAEQQQRGQRGRNPLFRYCHGYPRYPLIAPKIGATGALRGRGTTCLTEHGAVAKVTGTATGRLSAPIHLSRAFRSSAARRIRRPRLIVRRSCSDIPLRASISGWAVRRGA